jgi:hypothetical protein
MGKEALLMLYEQAKITIAVISPDIFCKTKESLS